MLPMTSGICFLYTEKEKEKTKDANKPENSNSL